MIKILFFFALIAGAFLLAKRFMSQGSGMTVDQARKLLEVGPDADAEAINTAHRRLISKVHPDSGGSAQLAAQVNAARDILLRNLPKP
jgi:DnaJ homolog subfamily C member 19